MNFLSQRTINAPPASVNPLQDGSVVNADFTRPLCEGLGFPVVRKQGVVSLIVGLLETVCPPTVRRFIVAVNVKQVTLGGV